MHELHLVGFTADHDGLIFSTKKGATSGAYVVGIDDALFAALEEARRMAMAEPDDAAARAAAERVRALRPTQRSNLSVRDIQSRLRSGMTLAQVAAEAGVDEDWVARFAAPVLAEQAAVVERAMAFSFTTARKGPSSRPLGEAVRWNLADKGISVDTSLQSSAWSAFQLEPGRWALRFTYTSRGRLQVAEWEVDLDAGELSGRNRLASELAYVEAGARRRKPPEVVAAPPPPPKKATSGRKGTPARTKTARAQAARATSTKAAAARAKAKAPTANSPAERARSGQSTAAKQGSARSGAGGSTKKAASSNEGRRRAVPPPPEASPPKRPTVGRPGITPAGSGGGKEPAGGLARFPAPRPAAGRPAGQGAAPPRPAPAANRQPAPEPTPRPAPPAARQSQYAPSPAPQPASRPTPPAARPPQPAGRPSPQPMGTRRVAPPSRPSPLAPTADAKPMPTAQTGDGPVPPPASTVRRLPAPSPAAASRRADRQPPAPLIELKPEPPPSQPEPQPAPPRAPASVRPVGGSDGRPTILIIDADRAGDRKRS